MSDTIAAVELTAEFISGTNPTTIRWTTADHAVFSSLFTSPYPPPDLHAVLHALDVIQGSTRPFTPEEQDRLCNLDLWPIDRVKEDITKIIGRKLFKSLISDTNAKIALHRTRTEAISKGKTVTLRLRFQQHDITHAALPWELIWTSEPTPWMIIQTRFSSYTRHLNLPTPPPKAKTRGVQTRILVLRPKADIPAWLRDKEHQLRMEAWKNLLSDKDIIIDEISPVTRTALFEYISSSPQPDIIHYYGHGRYKQGRGELFIDKEQSEDGEWLEVDRISSLCSGAGLVVLNACQGAMAHDMEVELGLLSGIAQALSAAGVPAVIGMQLTARARPAAEFSAAVYRAYAAGKSLEEAVAQARYKLYISEPDQMSWFVPTVYLRS